MEIYFDLLHDCKVNCIDTTLLYALDCVKNGNLDDAHCNKETMFDMAKLVNDVWLESDIDLAISRIADVIVDNYNEIQQQNDCDRVSFVLDEYTDTLCNH